MKIEKLIINDKVGDYKNSEENNVIILAEKLNEIINWINMREEMEDEQIENQAKQ